MARKNNITDQEIIKLYKKGHSLQLISEISGLSSRTIRNIMTKYNIQKRPIDQQRKHQINPQFFKSWSNEMAWVLGLLYTDGCLRKNSYTITLAQKDVNMLKQVAHVIGCDLVLTNSTVPSLIINSKEIYQDLIDLGLMPNKSKTIQFPKVPEEFLPSFIRGVIDGDGWIQKSSYVMNITTASTDFAIGLLNTFKKWHLNSDIMDYISNNGNTYYRVWIRGKKSIYILSKIIYVNALNFNEEKRKRIYQWSDEKHVD